MTDLQQRNRDRISQSHADRNQQLLSDQERRKRLPAPSYSSGYNANSGRVNVTTIGRGSSSANLGTNGGIATGDRLSVRGGFVDAMPRPTEEQPEEPQGGLQIKWEFEAQNGAQWQQDKRYDATIRFEDSANCGGTNDRVQSGTAIAKFQLRSRRQLTLNLTGRVETQNPGFERISVSLKQGGRVTTLLSAQSTGANGGCAMEDKALGMGMSRSLPPGRYELRIESSTIDGLFHSGAYWKTEIRLSAARDF